MDADAVLTILRDTGALLEGHFELRSGLHSAQFFQCANVMRFPRHAETLCAELVRRCRTELGEDPADAVISPAMGGIIVGHEVGRALDLPCIFAEKVDGDLAMRRFRIEAGKRYVIAEDVITRGGRVDETIALVEAGGGRVTAVLLLVDRSAGNTDFGCPTHSLLQMAPEVFDPASCPMCDRNEPFLHPGS
jgi:orotate phosphoribosyltransferase